MKTRLLCALAIIGTAAAATASGQAVRPDSVSYMSRLFRMNGIGNLANPRYSRDGRWLAFDATRAADGTGQHIFVVPASGGTPVAITTGSQSDVSPMWTANGDRIVYHSSLTGGVMTVAIDPATGRAAGAPKRVTIDSVPPRAFDVTPDGRQVAYATATAAGEYAVRVVPINGGPASTIATVQGGANYVPSPVRFDRPGTSLYFPLQRPATAVANGYGVRDVLRLPISGGAPVTVFTIPRGLMGVQLDPVADRVIVRNGDRAHVLTLAGDSVATIAWAGFRTVAQLAFAPDGSSIMSAIDATRASIHVIPLDGGPIRALTDSSGYPWPDYWLGNGIYVSGENSGNRDDLLTMDGKRTAFSYDLAKANDGVPVRVTSNDPFADGIHHAVKGVSAAGDTTLFVVNSRTGEGRRVAQQVTGSQFWVTGTGDSYSRRVGNEMLYRTVRNGVVEVHQFDQSGADRVVHRGAQPTGRARVAVAPGRTAHAYQRGDTAFLDVTIGSAKPVRVLTQRGAMMGEIVFTADGSTLYADVSTGQGETYRQRGAFFRTDDARALATPARWVEVGDCWHPTWLPDGSGVLAFCENATGTRTWVSRVPAAGPTTTQVLTPRESALFWDYTLSPDGKSIAVPAESGAGMQLWRIDLKAAAKGQGKR